MPARRSGAKQGDIADTGKVGPGDRQGVFVHAFKCRRCSLEFQLYSWRRDRHKVGQVFCPECGEQTPMLHWRTCVNQSLEVGSGEDGAWEIFTLTTRFPDFLLMDDSVVG